ncbi:MAG: hypothetical protein HY873_05965 [Chloroflexi bacterium]|nr:hypothetical protein [Chloroflexota bacterium]
MKRLSLGVGIAMCAVASIAGVPGNSRSALADEPPLAGLEELSGVEFGDFSQFPSEPPPASSVESPAPAAPIEQPLPGSNDAANPKITKAELDPATQRDATAPMVLPSTGTGAGDRGVVITAGFALAFALAGLVCLGGAHALEAVRTRDC